MRFYLVRPGATEPPGWVATTYPDDSLTVYVWVPSLDRFVYDAALSGEIGYPMTEIVFEPISADRAAELVAEGMIGRRDKRTHKRLMDRLAAEERILARGQVLPDDGAVRAARERLGRIDDVRAAHRLHQAGRTQRQIADTLHTTQPRVHRMLRAAEAMGDTETPEEAILRATVDRTDRETLVTALSEMTYTFTEYAPEPFEGAAPGTWDQVGDAHAAGLLTDKEYERVRACVLGPLLR